MSPIPARGPDFVPCLVAVYNYKGGVGKTTTCIELGYALSLTRRTPDKPGTENDKYRVLLVDADPQCNLSNCLLRPDSKKTRKKTVNAKYTDLDCPNVYTFTCREERTAVFDFPAYDQNLETLLHPHYYEVDKQKMLNSVRDPKSKLLAKVAVSFMLN